jgi:uncharacterized protein YbjQ (UPF0145 family)
MLEAAGNINQPYEVLGVVHAVVAKPAKGAGCSGSGGLPIQEAFDEVLKALRDAASRSGGNGLIHINYSHRTSSTQVGCSNQSTAVFEVYGWATVIKISN